jgi:glycosyltransferase involved in cell wall biosynthesis
MNSDKEINENSNVLFISSWEKAGGESTYSKYLVPEIEEHIEVDVFPWDYESFLLRVLAIPVLNLSFFKKVKKYDVVQIEYHFGRYLLSLPIISLICTLAGTPLIVSQHETFDNLPLSKFVYLYHQAVYTGIDVILVRTQHRKNIIAEHHREKTRVFPHGIIRRPDLQREPRDIERLLIPGIIKPGKGYETAIRALDGLQVDCRLRIVGSPTTSILFSDNYYNKLKQLASESEVNDQITWVEDYLPEEEFLEEFRNADLILMPYKENNTAMSGVLNHAISWNVPTIIAGHSNFKSAIPFEGPFFSPVEPQELREKIELLDKDKEEQANIINGFRNMAEENSWANTAEKHVKLYEDLK